MSLHTLRLLTVCTLSLLMVSAAHCAESPEGNAWNTPSEAADSAVAAWASESLTPSNAKALAEPNPFEATSNVAVLSQKLEGQKLPGQELPVQNQVEQVSPFDFPVGLNNNSQPQTASEETVSYEPNDSQVIALPEQSGNPLRSGSRSATNFNRQPATPSAAEQAFAAPQQEVVSQLNRAARVAFDQPMQEQQPETLQSLDAPQPFDIAAVNNDAIEPVVTIPLEQVAAEPRPFMSEQATEQVAPLQELEAVVQQPAALAPVDNNGERSVLASRQPAWNQTPERSFELPTEPTFNANVSQSTSGTAASGTGQPGEILLEGPQVPSLKIEKRCPAESRVGQPCRFVLTVRNTGNQTARNVVLRDEVPAGSRLVKTVPSAEAPMMAGNSNKIVWQLGDLPSGEQRSVELHVVPERQGEIGSVATVSFDASASAKTICTQPEIAVRLTAPAKVRVGQKQPLKIEIHNPGTGVATNVVIVEEVPQNLSHSAGPSLEFAIGTLAPGETRQLDLMLTAKQAGAVVNQLTATADGGLNVIQTVAFEVVAPSLALEIKGPKRRYLNRPASYTVNIDNPGSAPAKDVRITTQLPRGLKFVRANNMGEYDAETHSVYWSLAELPNGEHGAVELVAMPINAGEHTLQVEGVADDGLKTTESKQLLVEGVVSLSFDVRDRQDPIEIGADVVYDVVVTNEGTKPASQVRVTLEAPAGMQVLDAQGKVSHRVVQGRVEFAPLATLNPGEKYPYRVRLRGNQAGDQRITVLVQSDDLEQPIRREESTRVFGDE